MQTTNKATGAAVGGGVGFAASMLVIRFIETLVGKTATPEVEGYAMTVLTSLSAWVGAFLASPNIDRNADGVPDVFQPGVQIPNDEVEI